MARFENFGLSANLYSIAVHFVARALQLIFWKEKGAWKYPTVQNMRRLVSGKEMLVTS